MRSAESSVTVTCDRSRWPIAHVVVDGPVTHDGTQKLLRVVEELFVSKETFSLVLETRNARGVAAPHIREWADFIRANRAELETYVRAVAFVMPSAMMRGAAKVLFSWVDPPFECTVVETPGAALAFVA